jgi:prophage antirepressor-like protein
MQNQEFQINTFFNNLPIRIIGTPEEPFFYASDIGDVLGLTKVSMSIKNFDETELVTPEVRAGNNLITYRKYKDEMRRDDSVILLTEYGVYRLILCSKSVIAKDFKRHIYQIIKNARLAERGKLEVIDKDDLKKLHETIDELKKSQADYAKYNPAIYVFSREINDNPYKHIPADQVDREIAREYDDIASTLYKFTTEPTAEDYTKSTLHAKIYGDSEQIMDELLEGALEIMPKALKHNRYHDNFDFELSYGKIVCM